MSEIKSSFGPKIDDVLREQVRTVLTNIHIETSLDIPSARLRTGSAPIDLRTDSIRLLYWYDFSKRRRSTVSFFLESPINKPLRALLITKSELEEGASNPSLYKTALEIIKEFFACLEHREALRNHKKAQRKIIDKGRPGFLYALALRDGKQCAKCKSKPRKLFIDHKIPVAHWGLSEFSNLRLLCFGCNSKKGAKLEDD